MAGNGGVSLGLARAAIQSAPVFVLGCARSGTTLLRLMLDSHPSLAIPDESEFIVELHSRWPELGGRTDLLLELVLAHWRFAHWRLDPELVRRLCAETRPSTYSALMRVVFAAYAADNGKRRWGDKTPFYLAHIPLLRELFPDAQFVHVIRDGREVAASLAAQRWGPDGAIEAALFWKGQVRTGRRAGASLPAGHYLEVKLEALLDDPEGVLRQVCDFIREPYAPSMLGYHLTAEQRVWSGSTPHRAVDHRHLSSPPQKGLRDWRVGLSEAEQRAVETAAQPTLRQLGYPAGRRSARSIIRVELRRARLFPGAARAAARASTARAGRRLLSHRHGRRAS